MSDYNDDQPNNSFGGGFPSETSGNYRVDPHTGTFSPYGSTSVGAGQQNSGAQMSNMVQAMMRNYLRKQIQPGSYLPLESAAPSNVLSSFKPLDKYRSFGVPYTGIQYGNQGNSSNNPYGAMFSPVPGGY